MSSDKKKCGGDCSTCACKAKKKPAAEKPKQTEILELLALTATVELINKKPKD